MALYHYTATMSSREDYRESGTVLAESEEEAKKKLRALRFDQVRLRKINGLKGLLGRLTATVK